MLEDVEIDDSSEIVDIRDEQVLLTDSEQFVDQTRIGDGVVQISVTRRVPVRRDQ